MGLPCIVYKFVYLYIRLVLKGVVKTIAQAYITLYWQNVTMLLYLFLTTLIRVFTISGRRRLSRIFMKTRRITIYAGNKTQILRHGFV